MTPRSPYSPPVEVVSPEELRLLDARYEPFPSLAEWARVEAPNGELEQLREELEGAKQALDEEQIRAAREVAVRAAAVDTGALEGLYETDRGLTVAIATQAAAWETQADERSEDLRRFFEAQLATYHLVLDAATEKTPVVEAWIRRLHEEICATQSTYRARTAQGVQRLSLKRGEYKTFPNHVRRQDGSFVSFAPVDETASEMHRLVQELESETFATAHTVLQAAYVHYALVRIHPFADGNGRVARAVASLYLYRAYSVPLVIFVDQREEYLAALEAADAGDLEGFVEFLGERVRDALRIFIHGAHRTGSPGADLQAVLQTLNASTATVRRSQDLSSRLAELAASHLRQRAASLDLPPSVRVEVRRHESELAPSSYPHREDFRALRKSAATPVVVVGFHASDRGAQNKMSFAVLAHEERPLLLLHPLSRGRDLKIEERDLSPRVSKVLEIAVGHWVEEVLGTGLAQMDRQLRSSL